MKFKNNNDQILEFFQEQNQVLTEGMIVNQLKKLKSIMGKGPKDLVKNKDNFMKVAKPITKVTNRIPNLEKKVIESASKYMKKEGVKDARSRVMKYKSQISKYVKDPKQATTYASIAAALSVKKQDAVDKVMNSAKKQGGVGEGLLTILGGLILIALGIAAIPTGWILIPLFIYGPVLILNGIVMLFEGGGQEERTISTGDKK